MMGELYSIITSESSGSDDMKYDFKNRIIRNNEYFVEYTQDLLWFTEVPHYNPETVCVKKIQRSVSRIQYTQDQLQFTEVPHYDPVTIS